MKLSERLELVLSFVEPGESRQTLGRTTDMFRWSLSGE